MASILSNSAGYQSCLYKKMVYIYTLYKQQFLLRVQYYSEPYSYGSLATPSSKIYIYIFSTQIIGIPQELKRTTHYSNT